MSACKLNAGMRASTEVLYEDSHSSAALLLRRRQETTSCDGIEGLSCAVVHQLSES